MRETAITTKTDVALLLLGSRLRADLSVQELSDKAGESPEAIFGYESDSQLGKSLAVAEMVNLLGATGTEVVARQRGEVEVEIAAEAEIQAAEEAAAKAERDRLVAEVAATWEPGARRVMYVRNAAELPHALRKARIFAGMTQERVAELMGLTSNGGNVSRHETGGAINVPTLLRYTRIYNCEFVLGPPPAGEGD